jgi:hypothetical protein
MKGRNKGEAKGELQECIEEGKLGGRIALTFTHLRAVARSSQMSTKGLLESCYAFAGFMMKCFPETETPSIR